MSQDRKNRKRPASGVLLVGGQPTVVFDTVCTRSRKAWLKTDDMHQALIDVWRNEATAWLVGRYVVMPDHIHYFAWATEPIVPFENWVKFWKSKFSWKHGQRDLRLQANDWDTRMRSESQYEEKWEYVRQNPVRAGLVEDVNDWPYQGTVHDLVW